MLYLNLKVKENENRPSENEVNSLVVSSIRTLEPNQKAGNTYRKCLSFSFADLASPSSGLPRALRCGISPLGSSALFNPFSTDFSVSEETECPGGLLQPDRCDLQITGVVSFLLLHFRHFHCSRRDDSSQLVTNDFHATLLLIKA
ncbi:hypothetical protein CDAR_181131 [Caerostris darwini]|uniref:Uncharacterized protein n=1 Tax=Caerostris darwini TaxID=1538125 RepID=A0AAV4U3Y3_9ARAC|nr:hypothetical protein CDAR_181131 [Caerostris darwini]